MGYFSSDNAVSAESADAEMNGIVSYMHDQQFTPSSTNTKQKKPALGSIVSSLAPMLDSSGGTSGGFKLIQPFTAPVIAPKPPAPVPVPYVPISPSSPGAVTPPSTYTPAPVLPSAPPPPPVAPSTQTPAQTQQTVTAAQNNADALSQQAQAAADAGNTALANSLSKQAISWTDISQAIQNAIPALPGGGGTSIPVDVTAPAAATVGPATADVAGGTINPKYLLFGALLLLAFAGKHA